MDHAFRNLVRALVCSVTAWLLAVPGGNAIAQDRFVPQAIESFDGRSWGGLTIGQSTTDDIKRAYATSKGAIRPEAMLLPQPEGSGVRVDALMHGRGGGSVLQGFRVAYADGAPILRDLADRLKQEPLLRYSPSD